ncbi:MAG TPA: hypothetical protein PK745_05640 [bacterium]|nr:hypothetical protein [bacterium]
MKMTLTTVMLRMDRSIPKTAQKMHPTMPTRNPVLFLFPMSQSPERVNAVPTQSM